MGWLNLFRGPRPASAQQESASGDLGAQKVDPPKTVRFWVVRHPQTKGYANIWTFPYMYGHEYGGHVWASKLKDALPFKSEERAREWWDTDKRAMKWTQEDDYTMGAADIVQVDTTPDNVQRGRTDSNDILSQLHK